MPALKRVSKPCAERKRLTCSKLLASIALIRSSSSSRSFRDSPRKDYSTISVYPKPVPILCVRPTRWCLSLPSRLRSAPGLMKKRRRKVCYTRVAFVKYANSASSHCRLVVIATCAELNIAVVAYSPLGRGFLTGSLGKLTGDCVCFYSFPKEHTNTVCRGRHAVLFYSFPGRGMSFRR